MGIAGISNATVSAYTPRRADGAATRSVSIKKPKTKKNKRPNYSYKRISAQILRAKTSGNAKQVMASARSQTVLLRRKLASGDYNEEQTKSALRHAEKMEKIAKKKMKHLQEEENAKKGGACQAEIDEKSEYGQEDMEALDVGMSAEEIKQLMQELQQELEEALEEISGLELLSVETGRDLDPADLELMKKKHRSEEMREIMEADVKYLKALFDQLAKEKQEASSGVYLQLLGVEVPVSEAPPAAAVVAEGGCVDASV